MGNSHYVRHGFGAVRAYVHGPLALLGFVEEVFGATEIERHEFNPEKFHVEYQIGDSVVVIEAGPLPEGFDDWISSIYVYVEEVDAVYARAQACGAEPFYPVVDHPYGERMGGVKDMAGNTWWIATLLQK